MTAHHQHPRSTSTPCAGVRFDRRARVRPRRRRRVDRDRPAQPAAGARDLPRPRRRHREIHDAHERGLESRVTDGFAAGDRAAMTVTVHLSDAASPSSATRSPTCATARSRAGSASRPGTTRSDARAPRPAPAGRRRGALGGRRPAAGRRARAARARPDRLRLRRRRAVRGADGADRAARAARRPARGPHRDAPAAARCVSLAQAAVAGALVFAGGLAAILALTALLGAGAALAGPAEARARRPRPSRAARLTQANGWVETARYAGFTAGPLLAGALTAAGGTRLGPRGQRRELPRRGRARAALHARAPRAVRRGAARRADSARRRCALAVRRPPCCAITIGAAVAGLLFISASMTVEVFYVRDVVGAGAPATRWCSPSWTAGMVLGAIAVAPRVRAPLATAALAALALQGARDGRRRVVGGAAAWVIAGFFVGGIGHGVKNVLLRTLIQQRVRAGRARPRVRRLQRRPQHRRARRARRSAACWWRRSARSPRC